ncbi:hypothetical protein ACJW30_09G132900 [Castanea mollissima]
MHIVLLNLSWVFVVFEVQRLEQKVLRQKWLHLFLLIVRGK